MIRFGKASIAALGIVALAGCSKSTASASDSTSTATAATTAAAPDRAADEQAVRAVNDAWYKAYNAHDVDGVAGLYADDAVLNPPGMAPARGHTAIHDAYQKDIAAAAKAGVSDVQGATPDVGISGDLAWEWNTTKVTDKSGKTVDTGKYVTVFARRDGKWMIIRDIWNSDIPSPPAK